MLAVIRFILRGLSTAALAGLVLARPLLGQQRDGDWRRAPVAGGQVEYQDRGHGEPVLFIHGAMVADLLAPLAADSAFSHFRVILPHRRGYAGSSSVGDHWSVQQDAADVAALLKHLGISRAHVVGHSAGGIVALEFAATFPQQVQTLTLLDPPLTFMQGQRLQPRTGGADAVEAFLLDKGKPDFREQLNMKVPGAIAQARKDERRFNVSEWQALGAWTFDAVRARKVTAPILFVSQQHAATVDTVRHWWPQMEFVEFTGETHMFPFEVPHRTGTTIARFLARHPM